MQYPSDPALKVELNNIKMSDNILVRVTDEVYGNPPFYATIKKCKLEFDDPKSK
jgi:hypothetical protein